MKIPRLRKKQTELNPNGQGPDGDKGALGPMIDGEFPAGSRSPIFGPEGDPGPQGIQGDQGLRGFPSIDLSYQRMANNFNLPTNPLEPYRKLSPFNSLVRSANPTFQNKRALDIMAPSSYNWYLPVSKWTGATPAYRLNALKYGQLKLDSNAFSLTGPFANVSTGIDSGYISTPKYGSYIAQSGSSLGIIATSPVSSPNTRVFTLPNNIPNSSITRNIFTSPWEDTLFYEIRQTSPTTKNYVVQVKYRLDGHNIVFDSITPIIEQGSGSEGVVYGTFVQPHPNMILGNKYRGGAVRLLVLIKNPTTGNWEDKSSTNDLTGWVGPSSGTFNYSTLLISTMTDVSPTNISKFRVGNNYYTTDKVSGLVKPYIVPALSGFFQNNVITPDWTRMVVFDGTAIKLYAWSHTNNELTSLLSSYTPVLAVTGWGFRGIQWGKFINGQSLLILAMDAGYAIEGGMTAEYPQDITILFEGQTGETDFQKLTAGQTVKVT